MVAVPGTAPSWDALRLSGHFHYLLRYFSVHIYGAGGNEIVPCLPPRVRSVVGAPHQRSGFRALARGEGEFARNVGSDRALSLLCSGRRVPPHAPTIEDLLHLLELWSPRQPRPILYKVRLPEMPEDGRDRPPLPRRIGAQAPRAEPSRASVSKILQRILVWRLSRILMFICGFGLCMKPGSTHLIFFTRFR